MDWVNLGLLIATCAAAGVAVWQAIEARGARDEAREASANAGRQATAAERAAGAAEETAQAQARASAALERQADLAERLAGPQRPFRLERVNEGETDQLWLATNMTNDFLLNTWVGTPNGLDDPWIQPERPGQAVDLEPGDSLRFTFVRRLSSPTRATVWIHWSDGVALRKQTETIG